MRVKQTSRMRLAMSANDPKRTSAARVFVPATRETREEAIQFAIEMGRYNPDIHDLIIIRLNTPVNREAQREQRKWTSELPAAPKRSKVDVITEEINALPKGDGPDPDAPRLEPRPERRYRINYPDIGIV